MEEFGRIYIIRNTINDKVYVGQTTKSVKLRFLNHLSAARKGKDYVIGKAIRKYGEENFYVETLEECLKSELNEREIYYIKFYNSTNPKFGYNMSKGGNKTAERKRYDDDVILSLWNSGLCAEKIAKKLHTHIQFITPVLKKYNIKYGQDKQKLDNTVISMIIDLYQLGYGTMDICRKLNVTKQSVRKYLQKNNIKLRSKEETNKLRRNLSTLK